MTQYKKICILCSAAVIASSICGANLKGQQAGAATNVSAQSYDQKLKNKLVKLKITYIYVGDEVPQNVQNYFDALYNSSTFSQLTTFQKALI